MCRDGWTEDAGICSDAFFEDRIPKAGIPFRGALASIADDGSAGFGEEENNWEEIDTGEDSEEPEDGTPAEILG